MKTTMKASTMTKTNRMNIIVKSEPHQESLNKIGLMQRPRKTD
jgi:hypothetical protein